MTGRVDLPCACDLRFIGLHAGYLTIDAGLPVCSLLAVYALYFFYTLPSSSVAARLLLGYFACHKFQQMAIKFRLAAAAAAA